MIKIYYICLSTVCFVSLRDFVKMKMFANHISPPNSHFYSIYLFNPPPQIMINKFSSSPSNINKNLISTSKLFNPNWGGGGAECTPVTYRAISLKRDLRNFLTFFIFSNSARFKPIWSKIVCKMSENFVRLALIVWEI